MDTNYQTVLINTLKLIAEPICGEIDVDVNSEGEQWRVNITSKNAVALLGIKGELIQAIQYLIRVIVHREFPDDRTKFLLDIGQGRKKREEYIVTNIPLLAQNDVLKSGVTYIIKNLTSYERKLVHDLLADVGGLETVSVGEGDNRKLLIRPTSGTGSLGMDNSKIIDINNIQDTK
jgi:spoIIIJ-associated protein